MAIGTFTNEPVIKSTKAWEPDLTDQLFDLWNDMGSAIGNTWDETKEVVSGTIDTVATAPSRAWESVKETAKEAVTNVTGGVESAFSWFSGKVLMIVGALLLVFVVLAKTGIIPQVSEMFRALYGG